MGIAFEFASNCLPAKSYPSNCISAYGFSSNCHPANAATAS
jgi:hypothetical protein